MALSDTFIKAIKSTEKPQKMTDGGGLFLIVSPLGGKWWRYSYRFESKQKTLSLGVYPDIGLKDARERHAIARKLLANGIDPSVKKQADKQAKEANRSNTFSVWAMKWYRHWSAGKSVRHAEYVKRRLENDIFPIIGNLPITEVQAPNIVKAIKSIAARGAFEIAKKSHQHIGQIFRYAIAHGDESMVMRNPATDIKPSDIIETPRKVNYARVEIKEVPDLLRAIEAANISQITRLAIKLMALTFLRTSELIGGKWDEIDFDEAQWRIPAERMKMKTPHIVPLSRQAVEILRILHIITGSSDFLFPSQSIGGKALTMSNNTILKALERMGYKGRMTGHGFRGLASTALHEQGFDHQHIELQLAHAERNEVSAAYNHAIYLKQRTIMMQTWADTLDKLKAGAQVIPLRA